MKDDTSLLLTLKPMKKLFLFLYPYKRRIKPICCIFLEKK